ncbi:MAG: hypothetical protein IPI77_25070 [Saprospiraceae bacterium]|nr:hypothetical protein [Saprospiraceae bacterium]
MITGSGAGFMVTVAILVSLEHDPKRTYLKVDVVAPAAGVNVPAPAVNVPPDPVSLLQVPQYLHR